MSDTSDYDQTALAVRLPLMWDAWGILLEEKPGARGTHVDQLELLDSLAQLNVCDESDCASLRTALLSCPELCCQHFSPVKGAYRVSIREVGEEACVR